MPSERYTEEAALVQSAQRGDTQAMEGLLIQYRPLLWSLAGRLCCMGCMQREELVQAGAMGLMRAIERYDAQQNVRLITYAVPWILGEMKRALQREESRCVSLEEESREGVSLLDVLQGNGGIDVEHVDLHRALQHLPAEEQTLICLRYYRDRTQKEAADLMHKSQAQVSRMERRALERLHEWLA